MSAVDRCKSMVTRSDKRDFVAEGVSTALEQKVQQGAIHFQPHFTEENANDPPEVFLMDQMAMRPRAMSHHLSSSKIPSRTWLMTKARFWRSLMTFAMTCFYDLAPPKPPKYSFIRRISTDTDPIELFFYLPLDFQQKTSNNPNYRYPVVVNFHGGGFALGHATDDRYWARVVLAKTPAIFVSVGYRRAPEHPFPQPVDDCVEALLFLQSNADELHLDPSKIALTGFSAGGNLAFTVPFRLTYQYEKMTSKEHLPSFEPQRINDDVWVPKPDDSEDLSNDQSTPASPNADSAQESAPISRITSQSGAPESTPTTHPAPPLHSSSSNPLLRQATGNVATTRGHQYAHGNLLDVPGPRSYLLRNITQDSLKKQGALSRTSTNTSGFAPNTHTNESPADPLSLTATRSLDTHLTPQIRIVSIIAWYPLLDWTLSRAQKKRSSRYPQKTLPRVFTDLFDFSYLPAPDVAGHHCSPYASPCLAPDHMIRDGLPNRIQMWLCEWDMLLAEGESFAERLRKCGKDIKQELVPGVPHAWDKSPNPFRDQKKIDALYERAAEGLRGVFDEASRKMTIGEGIGLGGIR